MFLFSFLSEGQQKSILRGYEGKQWCEEVGILEGGIKS